MLSSGVSGWTAWAGARIIPPPFRRGASNLEVEYGLRTDPYSTPGFLPEQLECELYFPRGIGAENLAKGCACQRTVRISKIRVVEQIEEF